MAISKKIETFMTKASWIRKMFEEGIRLKNEVGEEKVFDFTLGNPILEPPEEYQEILRKYIAEPTPGSHRYMPNAGYPATRLKVADYLKKTTGTPLEAGDIIMTCGAGGAMNVSLKALLDPGDEVVVIAPFFPEYRFYIDNHGGCMVIAESADDFDLDLAALKAAIGGRTKAIILNSPNNPTGKMYTAERLRELGDLLGEKEQEAGHPITILSDEPYRKIVFDGKKTPSIFDAHANTILITSHSKDIGLPGERIGFAAISAQHQDRSILREAMTFTNRTLGYVNAPALFQRTVALAQDMSVPVAVYQNLRDLFCVGLNEAGLRISKPDGAFYLFPKTPGEDDMAFIRDLQKEYILAVPGSGFGRPGHIRLSYCVTEKEIRGSLPGFRRVMQKYN
ncbi:MAG: pyridoxal phosphate-dependent aminotransferase [Candidatus Eisenbacteria bacterium]|uniref:Pyridoxal phosphate-dependent aminotransferase n=1 Tax=Eiseniibacteriota bacterium TaxID=2212470 RepID=A0A948W7N5_UNCEI|nr:pyridoxal phosphate-dependent aminotransferase [Candidatus Eisenbacteria bacterium]MBU1950580.1 pyridoxal phosphate-dependent aminotransferase [Candidatus Eisenbacteria bacterium]MBU2692440.1 pyridoxal phosphate-dependent aminotransferase [Candidatus Eisenbacteria bacterium]